MMTGGSERHLRLLSTNSASRLLRENPRLLIYGNCVRIEHPDLFKEECAGRVCLSTCPESEHINVIALKIASILSRVELKELVVLSIDGSPHCVQLHHAVEEAIRVSRAPEVVKHVVIHRGRRSEVSSETIKLARYLYKIEKLRVRASSKQI